MKKIVITLLVLGSANLALADGAALFKNCSICHGEKAEKSSLNVSKVIAGWPADKIVERLKAYKSKKLDQYGFGSMMYNKATKLTDEEMVEVAKYIESLKPAE